jgi:hypothetical protein
LRVSKATAEHTKLSETVKIDGLFLDGLGGDSSVGARVVPTVRFVHKGT